MREADPTQFSPLPIEEVKKVGEIEDKGMDVVEADGQEFVELHGLLADSGQFVVAKVLKGIVNVSDVVRSSDGKFYSKVMPLERIEQVTPEDEMGADFFIMRALFEDGDHHYEEPTDNISGRIKNVIRSNGRTVYFDFENARQLQPNTPWTRHASSGALRMADEKLQILRDRLDGASGAIYIHAILQSSGETADKVFPAFRDEPNPAVALQQTLLEKIDTARTDIRERLERSTEAA